MIRFIAVFSMLLIQCFTASGADWPARRGPTGQGECAEKDVPLKWSATENVKWKVALAEQGNSTPIIRGDRIFLTQANTGGTIRSLLCLGRDDGKLLWQTDVAYADKERSYNPKWYANASPVTDGQRVVVSFGSAGMYCFDFEGKELWKRTDLGKWEHTYGNGSSPVLYDDLAILWCGPNQSNNGRNFLLAVDKKTGTTAWEHDEKGGSWSTPLITSINGQNQLILGVPHKLKGFDPKTGKELWSCDGLTDLVYTSALYTPSSKAEAGIAVAMSGFTGSALAVKLGGTGDITKDRLWRHPKNIQRVGSGLIVGDHVYIVEENGLPHCYELTTGKEVWELETRLGSTTWGSMVHAEGRLYVLMRNGDTIVLAASPKYEVLATNTLGRGENTNSSIVISNGEIFIRTFKNLWCIREKK